MRTKSAFAAGAAKAVLTLALIGATTPALAQSTAGQANEVIVTGSREPPSTGGLATQVSVAKDEAIITQQFIQTQLGSTNFGQLINMLPGVSYSTEDPGGFNSGDLRVHGFDCAHIAVVLDGAPLNDTGNYACYPGEYLVSELIDHVTVNIGSSDVDSPSASALGATVNIVSKRPPEAPGGVAKVSYGSNSYARGYGELDTGAFGPWGTTALFAGEYGYENNFKGRPGDSRRWDLNTKIFQPLSGSDFISIAANYTSERQYPAFRATPTTLAAAKDPYFFGDNYTWTPETVTPGGVDTVPQNVGPAGGDANYWALFPNPVEFASVRGQSHFALNDKLSFTFDPSFFYTLANGGGSTSLSEKDKRLIGSSGAAGVDLNGDGDILDTVVAYAPSNTQTFRYGLTTSLLYDMDEHNHFQLAYTLDYGHHRQTGEFTAVNPATGQPANVFGGKPGYGPSIATADGDILRTRDRLSIAMLNQISANYIGKYLDDRLHINLGLRAPFFERNLNQYCYTYNGGSAWCDTVSQSLVQTAYNADLAAQRTPGASASALASLLGASVTTGAGGVPNFRFPFAAKYNFSKLLPNAGISFRIADAHFLYASYAKGFSAPKTDDLYTSTPELVRPEVSDNFTAGYRFQTRMLNLSVNVYDTEYKNRIVQSYDPNDPSLSIDRNVGDARVRGVDIEGGWKPTDRLDIYGSANFNKSELKSNYTLTTSGVTFALPTQGKELVLTPDREFSGRISYDFGPVTIGGEGKYISSRFISDTNDASIPSYAIFSLDARLKLPQVGDHAYLQFNVQNLFDKYYISRSTTFANGVAYPIPGTSLSYFPSTPAYYIGAPRTMQVTLAATF